MKWFLKKASPDGKPSFKEISPTFTPFPPSRGPNLPIYIPPPPPPRTC